MYQQLHRFSEKGKRQDDRGVGCNRQTYQGQVDKQNPKCPMATSLTATILKLSLRGLADSLPALDLPCEVVARGRARELDFTVQGGIAEEVTEVLKELQKLVRRVLEHSDHLCAHHVVHHKEGGLQTRGSQWGGAAVPRPLSTSPELHTTQQPTQGPLPGHKLGSSAP